MQKNNNKVINNIPNATFILAHSGCFDFDYMTSILKEFPNTYTDISVQPSKNIRKLIDSVGSSRLLFGTDYPFVSQAFSIVSVLRATELEQDRNNIFSNNAKQLLKI